MRGKKFPRIIEVMERLRETNLSLFFVSWAQAWSFGDQFNVTEQPLPTPELCLWLPNLLLLPYLLSNFWWLFYCWPFLSFFSILLLFFFLCLPFGSQFFSHLKDTRRKGIGRTQYPARLHSLNSRPLKEAFLCWGHLQTPAQVLTIPICH